MSEALSDERLADIREFLDYCDADSTGAIAMSRNPERLLGIAKELQSEVKRLKEERKQFIHDNNRGEIWPPGIIS